MIIALQKILKLAAVTGPNWRILAFKCNVTKLADLARLERVLAATVAKCSGGSAPTCPVLDVLATRTVDN